MNNLTYITAEQTAERLNFSVRYFRNIVMKRSLVEGVHYIRPFGGRKILFIWERVEAELLRGVSPDGAVCIPMASGGVCNV